MATPGPSTAGRSPVIAAAGWTSATIYAKPWIAAPRSYAAFFTSRFIAIIVSAICTAFSAAPFRRLSETHQNDRPFATVGSLRMRLTNTASSPAHSTGVT